MGPEEKCRHYKSKLTEEYPCFNMWFTVVNGKILDFKEDNHGVLIVHGLPLQVVWDVMDAVKDDIEGDNYEMLPEEGKHVLTVKVSDIEYFGGQWSEDACTWEIAPAYWFCTELIKSKTWQEIVNEMTPELFK